MSMSAAAARETAATVTFAVLNAGTAPDIMTESSTIIAAPASTMTTIIAVFIQPKNILYLIMRPLGQSSSSSEAAFWFSER